MHKSKIKSLLLSIIHGFLSAYGTKILRRFCAIALQTISPVGRRQYQIIAGHGYLGVGVMQLMLIDARFKFRPKQFPVPALAVVIF